MSQTIHEMLHAIRGPKAADARFLSSGLHDAITALAGAATPANMQAVHAYWARSWRLLNFPDPETTERTAA